MATETKVTHTPGPWAVHPITAQVDGFATGEPVPICRLLWPTKLRSEDETEANGHLIASAPELLAALKHAVEWLDDEGCNCDVDEPVTCALCEAQAVIAKAEGR